MFDYEQAAAAVQDGSVSPLTLLPELESLTDDALLLLDPGAALAVVEITQAVTSAVSAISALAMEALTRREVEQATRERDDRRRRGERDFGTLGEDLAIGTLAPVVHLTPRTMGTHLDAVRTLVNHLPRTFALVRAGRLDLHRAGAVAAEALLVAPDLRATFDHEVTTLPTRCRTPLVDLTPGGVHRRAAAAAVRVDPDSAAARAAAALDERFVRVRPGADPGVTAWSASLPSARSLEAWAAVEALASQYATADPARRIDQARADALLDLVLAQATVRTTIEILVPYTSTASAGGGTDGTLVDGSGTAGVAPRIAPGEPKPKTTTMTKTRGVWPPTRSRGRRSPLERHLQLVASHGIVVEMLIHGASAHATVDPRGTLLGDRGPAERVPDVHTGGDEAEDHRLHPDLTDLLLTEPAPGEDREPDDEHAAGGPGAAGPTDPAGPTLPSRGLPPVVLPTGLVGVRHPRVGIILNSALTAWLADPDTRIRLGGHDPVTSAITVHDPTTYRPNQRLARIVRARDGHCRFPGCTTDAARTQLDHVTPFPLGPTTSANLACLCSTHHAFKHHSGWHLTIDADGACTWTTPQGRTHVTHPRVVSELVA